MTTTTIETTDRTATTTTESPIGFAASRADSLDAWSHTGAPVLKVYSILFVSDFLSADSHSKSSSIVSIGCASIRHKFAPELRLLTTADGEFIAPRKSSDGVFSGVVRAKGHLWLASANARPIDLHVAGGAVVAMVAVVVGCKVWQGNSPVSLREEFCRFVIDGFWVSDLPTM